MDSPTDAKTVRARGRLTVKEFAELLSVNPYRVYKWIERGHLPVTPFGSQHMIDRIQLDRMKRLFDIK